MPLPPLELAELLQAEASADARPQAFTRCLQQSLKRLDARYLPLQQGLRHSSYALADSCDFVLMSRHSDTRAVHLRVAVFYQGVVAGCSCADDPTPTDTVGESCEISIRIDRKTAAAVITLLDEDW